MADIDRFFCSTVIHANETCNLTKLYFLLLTFSEPFANGLGTRDIVRVIYNPS